MATTNRVGNQLKFTNLDYGSILKSISDRINANPDFANFRESSIAQTIIEIFAGTADLVNYYTERQAEESYFETSQRVSSAILNSRNLAYDITRIIPATTTVSINITGNMQGKILAGRKLQIPIFSKFTYNDNDFILKKGFTYTFTQQDQNDATIAGDNYSKIISSDDNGESITLIQGTVKSIVIDGTTNPQVGQMFQSYKIPDTTFSNYYGDADLSDYPITRVWVGQNDTDPDNEYLINRRSLINDATIQGVLNNKNIKCCLIRTAVEGDVELKFGSAKIASIGADIINVPSTTFDNIYIQYLSTIGTKANLVGIINDRLDYSNQIIINNNNITSYTVFKFATNIVGGGDLETAESIKTNAPAIFYSLDRAVNKQDHINILKSLTSPITVKNALAWGEQEEAAAIGVAAIVELFNVAFFSCVGSLYNLEGDPAADTYSVKTNNNRIDEAVLDAGFDQDAMASQYFFNIYIKSMIAQQLKEQIIATWFWQIHGSFVPVAGNLAPVYFQTTYPNNVTVNYGYNSDKYLTHDNNLDLGGKLDSIVINISSINTIGADQGMNDIATIIQAQLITKIDTRSNIINGKEQNGNYGKLQFSGITVTWNGNERKFSIQTTASDPCYLSSIIPDNALIQELGMHNAADLRAPAIAIKIDTNVNQNTISAKIVEVLDYMSKKGMITLKYIYASPIIQSFRLAGNIYIEQLFSIDDLHRQINNAIYQFLDEHADYKVEVFLSNIIDIIENFPGVDHADVKFEPDIPVISQAGSPRSTFYYPIPGSYDPIDKYGTDTTTIFSTVNSKLNTYFTMGSDLSDFENSWRSFINYTRSLSPDQIYDIQSYTNFKLTERKFLSELSKQIYDDLVTAIGASTSSITKFQDTPDFVTLISDLHKDLTWLIRSNMIESNGNIAPEYEISTNDFGVITKKLLRGGYSLGNEIVKINLEATPIINNTATPVLIYQYK